MVQVTGSNWFLPQNGRTGLNWQVWFGPTPYNTALQFFKISRLGDCNVSIGFCHV